MDLAERLVLLPTRHLCLEGHRSRSPILLELPSTTMAFPFPPRRLPQARSESFLTPLARKCPLVALRSLLTPNSQHSIERWLALSVRTPIISRRPFMLPPKSVLDRSTTTSHRETPLDCRSRLRTASGASFRMRSKPAATIPFVLYRGFLEELTIKPSVVHCPAMPISPFSRSSVALPRLAEKRPTMQVRLVASCVMRWITLSLRLTRRLGRPQISSTAT